MKKFLYLCLFGTALAGGTAWAISAADGVNMAYGRATGVSREQLEAAAKAARNTSSGSAAKAASNTVGSAAKTGSVSYKGVEGAFYGTTHTNSSASWSTDILNGDGVKIGSVKSYFSNGKLVENVSLNDVGKKAGYTISGGKLTAPASTGSIANATDATRSTGALNQQGNIEAAVKVAQEKDFKLGDGVADELTNAGNTGTPSEVLDASADVIYSSRMDAVHAGMENAGIISMEDLGDGTTRITMKDGSVWVNDYPLSQTQDQFIPAGAKFKTDVAATPASGANTPTPDAGFDAEAVYGKYNKDMMDHLESQWNGTLPKVLPTGALDTGFMREAGINSFIENANGTVDLKMGSDWFGSSLTMDTKDFNAIFGKGGELPIQETHIGGGQSVLSLPNGSVLKEAQNGLLTDGKGNFFLESGGNAYPVDPNMSPAELQTVANQAKAKEALKAALVPSGIDKANVTNAFEYALQILEAVEGINQDDATKETTVKGVQSLQNSQGGASDYSMGTDVSLEATTISSAAELMVELLKNNPMNLTYMDETKCAEYKEDTSTRRECLQEMKKISANATALSGVMIAEGSNAISSKFYDRIKNFTDINNNLGTGSLGAMSVINDAERYPYFEMVRGTALSAVQLGVKEMGTLTELDDLAKEAENAQ